MNRETLYRGKRCSLSYEGQDPWVYGYYVESHHSWNGHKPHKSWILPSPRTNGGWFALMGRTPVIDETVGQYTGLKDKNGKEIYEGDILQTRANFKGVVMWHRNGNFYMNDDKELKEKSCENLGVMLEYAQFEVIGNIYDNNNIGTK